MSSLMWIQVKQYPERHRAGSYGVLPAKEAGDEIIPPGRWAALIKTIPWGVARAGEYIKTDALRLLITVPSRREPAQRTKTQYPAKRLFERIGASVASVESALIQVVGDISPQKCENCLKQNGPWAHCVRFDDVSRLTTASGNCTFNGNKKRCTFYQIPTGGGAISHKLTRSNSSSISSQHTQFRVDLQRIDSRDSEWDQLIADTRAHQAKLNMIFTQISMLRNRPDQGTFETFRELLPSQTPEQIMAQAERLINNMERMRTWA
ncbi:unnamed protein product [Penicillium bialowiezense]